jgi:predicted CXXCH cytochrome family protein
VKRPFLAAALVLLCIFKLAAQQISGDTLGAHDLTPSGTSPVRGNLSAACQYCHAPHSGLGQGTPLWNQTLSTQTYTMYTSSTFAGKPSPQPPLGGSSSLCLSCHDGTVAPGQTVAYGKFNMTGIMNSADVFSSDLESSHPFNLALPLQDSPDLVATLVSAGKTADPTGNVKLINGNIQCMTCHDPHSQSTDKNSPNFLVIDSSRGQMCLACHDPNRVTTGLANPLTGWQTSIHATAPNSVANTPPVGVYKDVATNACSSCHRTHNAPGAQRLLRGANEQDCINCHSGGNNVAPQLLNVYAEFSKIGHPLPSAKNVHDPAESTVLNNNRHATCADCHNSHASNQVVNFPSPPVLRASQMGIAGVSDTDGMTPLAPAKNQYENCLRCHGTSAGKTANPIYGYLPARVVSSGDLLNVIPQFALSSSSSHPVLHTRSSALPQPSLRGNMLNLDGVTPGRNMGTQILCTDCHNADDNREFGGAGPNGPHGSKWTHILERRYEISVAAAPGQPITNLLPNPDLSVNGPYSMCAKCHDLSQILANSSFLQHARHINDGFSCSVCHTAHGMSLASATLSGERLVNFDANVVAMNGTNPISYNRATNTCSLVCHQHAH